MQSPYQVGDERARLATRRGEPYVPTELLQAASKSWTGLSKD